ncbi:hypothetical protein IOC57_12515 [Bacillus sp. SD075]|nr:hypothetical protein [Bacillus sp. SD075]
MVELTTSSDLFEEVLYEITEDTLRLTETVQVGKAISTIVTIPLNQVIYIRVITRNRPAIYEVAVSCMHLKCLFILQFLYIPFTEIPRCSRNVISDPYRLVY